MFCAVVQTPRTGAYVMVRLAPSSSCNQTAGITPAGAAGDSSVLCVSSMMAQEGGQAELKVVW